MSKRFQNKQECTNGRGIIFTMWLSPHESTTVSRIIMVNVPGLMLWHDVGLSGRNSYFDSQR
eukprot:2151010-Pyramimonas_sp.AAC.1